MNNRSLAAGWIVIFAVVTAVLGSLFYTGQHAVQLAPFEQNSIPPFRG